MTKQGIVGGGPHSPAPTPFRTCTGRLHYRIFVGQSLWNGGIAQGPTEPGVKLNRRACHCRRGAQRAHRWSIGAAGTYRRTEFPSESDGEITFALYRLVSPDRVAGRLRQSNPGLASWF
jgi:hypothetical protein